MNKDAGLTEGPIWKKLISFTIPLFLGNLFQQLYNTVDSLVVGNFAGEASLAAVTSSGSVIFMMVGFFYGIAAGAGVVIARYYGARDFRSVERAIHTDIAFALAAGLVLSVVGLIATPQILRWMGTPENVMPNSIVYFRVYFSGVLSMIMYNMCSGILQAMGDSRHPLYYLVCSSLINVALDLIFVGLMKKGVGWAALATVIAQTVSAILALRRLICRSEVRLKLREIRFDRFMLRQTVRFGLPSGVQNSIISIANIVVQSHINAFGSTAMAGCGSYSKVEGFGFLPITCMAMALTTFVSQNLGAKQYDRAKKGAAFGTLCSVVLAEVIGVVVWLAAPFLIRCFNSDPEVVEYGVRQARTISLFYFLLSYSHCASGILRGAGRPVVPMYAMLVCWCVIRIAYITIATRFFPDISTIFWAYPMTWSLTTVLFTVYLLRSDWLHFLDKKEALQGGA